MVKKEYTPGPWRANGIHVVVPERPSYQTEPREVSMEVPGVSFNEAVANARLIAAAPELLEALRANAEVIHSDVHMNSGGRDFRGCEIASCKRAAEAIAKATS